MRKLFPISLLLLAGSFAASAAIDSGLLALVPSGSKIITSIDVQRARSSDFGQYLLRRMDAEDRGFQELAQQTGFDPRRDLQDLVFASGGPAADRTNSRFAILARGTFDPDRIATAAKAKSAVVQKYQDVDVFVDPSNHQRTAFAFPETGVAVFGDLETVQLVMASRSNPANLDPALQDLVSKAGADNDAWFVSLMPGSYLSQHLNQEPKQPAAAQAQALQSITESSGGIRFGGDIQVSFDAITRSAKDATSLADVVRFLASMAQMQAQKTQPGPGADILNSALGNMDLKADGNTMHLSISLPEKSLEQLADLGPAAHAHRARPTTR